MTKLTLDEKTAYEAMRALMSRIDATAVAKLHPELNDADRLKHLADLTKGFRKP